MKMWQHMDELFIAKFMFTIDDRINEWLTKCMRANSINDTDIDLINFKSITKKIKHKTFHPYVPPNIRKISDVPEIDDKPDPKRLKIEGQIKKITRW